MSTGGGGRVGGGRVLAPRPGRIAGFGGGADPVVAVADSFHHRLISRDPPGRAP